MNYDLIHQAEWLLSTANISPEIDSRIRSFLLSFSPERLKKCVEWLKENQCEPRDPAKQFIHRIKNTRL
jgi:hypothetical protein